MPSQVKLTIFSASLKLALENTAKAMYLLASLFQILAKLLAHIQISPLQNLRSYLNLIFMSRGYAR
jgi:hypothetical protein